MAILNNYLQITTKKIVLGAVLLAGSVAAEASDRPDDWQFGLDIYAWLPSVSGTMKFSPPDGAGGGVEADAEKLLDSLEMTFMLSFEARKGRWSGFTDVIYLDLEGSGSKAATLPNGDSYELFDAELKFESWVWTLGGAYSIWQENNSHLSLFAGARLLSLDTELNVDGAGPLQAELRLSESLDIWDGIIGAKGRIALNEHWFLPYYADIGTGDSDLTLQAAGGVGYSFNWGDIVLDYRYLEYDQDDDKLLQDIVFGGGRLGVVFRF